MKTRILTFTFVLSLFLLTESCKKDTDSTVEYQTINSTLKKNQVFQHDFGRIGIEDDLFISKAASHSKTSMVGRDDAEKIIYTYQPSQDYVGTDEVEILHSISNGATVVSTIKTKIMLTIID